jgi:hypothetical protein
MHKVVDLRAGRKFHWRKLFLAMVGVRPWGAVLAPSFGAALLLEGLGAFLTNPPKPRAILRAWVGF